MRHKYASARTTNDKLVEIGWETHEGRTVIYVAGYGYDMATLAKHRAPKGSEFCVYHHLDPRKQIVIDAEDTQAIYECAWSLSDLERKDLEYIRNIWFGFETMKSALWAQGKDMDSPEWAAVHLLYDAVEQLWDQAMEKQHARV